MTLEEGLIGNYWAYLCVKESEQLAEETIVRWAIDAVDEFDLDK